MLKRKGGLVLVFAPSVVNARVVQKPSGAEALLLRAFPVTVTGVQGCFGSLGAYWIPYSLCVSPHMIL